MNPEVGAMMCVQGDLSTAVAISTRPSRYGVMKILFGDAIYVLLMAQGILPRLILNVNIPHIRALGSELPLPT